MSPPVADDQHAWDAGALGERLVDIGLQRHQLAAAQPFVGGDDEASNRNPGCGPASASGEKPPNTTEWIAPIRAQASMAKAASGIIGM
jgi:hypothetical protein